MFYCKHCKHFRLCKHHDQTVDYAVDDGVCRYFEKDTDVLTNADRIRAMSDEELACWICSICGECGDCVAFDLCSAGGGTSNGLKKWIKQPAEVEG